jgi:formylglycine-generating enzyme required for sulfatase activity
MSPEQASGEAIDTRADIYSLGVMLYEMLIGQPPFEADSAVAILMKHLNEPVPDIRQLNGDVPDELVVVVERALAKEPEDRYQTAAQMAAALRAVDEYGRTEAPVSSMEVSESEPRGHDVTLVATGASPAQVAEKRNRAPWIVGATLGVILVLVLGIGLFFAARQLAGQSISAEGANLPSGDGMVRVNEGVYLVGLDAPDKQHTIPRQFELGEFWIDQYEVMNAQYAEFLADTDYAPPANWPDGNVPQGQETHPVSGVAWELAADYCEWAKKRLPTEAEWEVAARGPQGLLYPWGDDQQAVELPKGGTYTIGSIATNRSPFGAFDMAGNVWEWVGETYAPIEAGHQVLRGGASGFLKDMAYRLEGDPKLPTMIAAAGFRCAADEVTGGAQAEEALVLAPLARGVLFRDEFSDPNSGWPTGEDERQRFGYHPAAFYHLELSAPNENLTIFRGLSLGDFTAEAEALVDHTDTDDGDFRYGLAIRQSDEGYYAFVVSARTGTWQALKYSGQDAEVLAEGEDDSIRGLSAADTLRVHADGSEFTFDINGQTVAQVSDPDYASGDVGYLLETLDETLVHIHYASLIIQEIGAGRHDSLTRDDFTDPSSGWPTLSQDNRTFGYHPPDFYHVEVAKTNDRLAVTREPRFENVIVEADVFVDHTDTQSGDFRYGLAARRSGDEFYAFTISPRTGAWHILKGSPTGLEVLAEGVHDSVQGLTSPDTLRVETSGSDLSFQINGQMVAEVSDADYASGDAGFFVETFDESLAHVHYDSLTIQEIEQ